MSKKRHVPDAERTATMVDLLRETHPLGVYGPKEGMAPSHVVLEEVAPGTGWMHGSRWADVLILSCWQSNGLTLDGYEVKASKDDLKRELADPDKHKRLARYCDHWWLVAWDDALLEGLTIPEDWGIKVTAPDVWGRSLETRRKAPKREPEAWPRAFVASLVRNAFEQSPGLAYVDRLLQYARDRAVHDGRNMVESEERRRLEPVAEILYGKDHWSWPSGAREPEKIVEALIQRLGGVPVDGKPQHSPLCSGNGVAPNPGCSCGLVEWLYREAQRNS